VEKSSPKNVVNFCYFLKASFKKQTLIERKFAQSGHPGLTNSPIQQRRSVSFELLQLHFPGNRFSKNVPKQTRASNQYRCAVETQVFGKLVTLRMADINPPDCLHRIPLPRFIRRCVDRKEFEEKKVI
jgi:hypothetical protein